MQEHEHQSHTARENQHLEEFALNTACDVRAEIVAALHTAYPGPRGTMPERRSSSNFGE